MPRSSQIDEPNEAHGSRVFSLRRSIYLISGVVVLTLILLAIGEYIYRFQLYALARQDLIGHSELPFVTPESTAVGWAEPLRNMLLDTYFSLPRSKRDSALLGTGLPIYELQIADRHLRYLKSTAEAVTARRFSVGLALDYVPARFRFDDFWVDVNVKLRGLTSLHFLPARPSLRIKFPSHYPLDGKTAINLIDPYDKGLTADSTSNWELERCGVLTWQSQFVVLKVNKKVVGLFQEIEHFGRSLTDRTNRPEGHIFSGNGQLFGKPGLAYDKASTAMARLQQCANVSTQMDKADCDWRFVDEYFDTERLACAAALSTLLGSTHAWAPDNLRLLFDPARGTFEPIPWDYSFYPLDRTQHPHGEALQSGYGLYFASIPEFRRQRDRFLGKLLRGRVHAMLDHANRLFDDLVLPLKNDSRHPDFARDRRYHDSYIRALGHNATFLNTLFNANDLRIGLAPAMNTAHLLQIENHGKAFISIQSVIVSENGRVKSIPLIPPHIVDGYWEEHPGKSTLTLPMASDVRLVGLEARNEVTGLALQESEIQTLETFLEPTVPTLENQKFIAMNLPPTVYIRDGTIHFGPGRVTLNETLEIPRQHPVVFEPGLHLQLSEGSSLLIYGDLKAQGTPQQPIQISGADTQRWGTIAVQGTRLHPAMVHLEHVQFSGGTGGKNDRVYFTGTLSVHDGRVTMKKNHFAGSLAEDVLNLKNAIVDLQGNRFEDAYIDAVDLDFCRGTLTENRIVSSANDCMDFSGSRLSVINNHVSSCGDKGISIGERSKIVLNGNLITRSSIGLAVKDASSLAASDNVLAHLGSGVSLYVKKPTYGPGTASLSRTVLYDVDTALQRDSRFTLDVSLTVRYLKDEVAAKSDKDLYALLSVFSFETTD